MLKAYAFTSGQPVVEIKKEEIAAKLEDEKTHLWIDISAPIDEHHDFLRDVMKFHHLEIEDLTHRGMLPKVEEYDNHLFLILHDIILQDRKEDRLLTYELFMFIGKNYVLTARHNRIRAADYYHDQVSALTHIFSRGGAEAVGHAVLRKMVDSYFPMLDRVEKMLDESEDVIFDSPSPKDMQHIFSLRKDIMKLRSIATQQLDVISRITVGEFEVLSPHGMLLARDLYDHLYRVSEKAASFRDMTMGLLDAYLSQINNRMNEVVKVLTIIATIMLPLGIVVGFYGMNFRSLPGLENPHGWIYTLVGMIIVIGGMFSYFKWKKWW
jgi:magnesium transporter